MAGLDELHPLRKLAALTADHLARAGAGPWEIPVRSGFVRDLRALPSCLPLSDAPCPPVRGLRHAAQAMGGDITPLAMVARSAFGHVRWTEFYAEDAWSQPFLAGFANGEGIGPDGRILCDHLILGLFVMGPGMTYPLHAHPAEEFYLVLSGEPAFKVGASADYRTVDTFGVVWHPADVPHSIRTGDAPTFAIFGWRGAIAARSWYSDDMNDPRRPRQHPTIAKS